jgi:LmbE family N-acetylglucosaminyl deacetylase
LVARPVLFQPSSGPEKIKMQILCVTAHPDDETVFAGGTLALLASRGARVDLLCCTRGEGGEAGEPPLCSRAELGAVREAELRCAARALGCSSVEFLPFRDPDVGPDGSLYAFASSPEDVAPRIQDYLSAHRPAAVITHGSNGEYGHPAHLLTHQACLQAARQKGIACVYTFSADFPGHPRKRSANRDDPADFVVNIDSSFERKLSAMECHRTQGALFVRRPSAEAGRPVPLREVVQRVESFRRIPIDSAKETPSGDILLLLADVIRGEDRSTPGGLVCNS